MIRDSGMWEVDSLHVRWKVSSSCTRAALFSFFRKFSRSGGPAGAGCATGWPTPTSPQQLKRLSLSNPRKSNYIHLLTRAFVVSTFYDQSGNRALSAPAIENVQVSLLTIELHIQFLLSIVQTKPLGGRSRQYRRITISFPSEQEPK